MGPYPSGGTLGMINFANTESHCITQVFNRFIEYLPYIMLFQTLILVFAEKFTFRIPRIAQRVERFYKNIVEESLFGKGKLAYYIFFSIPWAHILLITCQQQILNLLKCCRYFFKGFLIFTFAQISQKNLPNNSPEHYLTF